MSLTKIRDSLYKFFIFFVMLVLLLLTLQNLGTTSIRFLNFEFVASKIVFIPGVFFLGGLCGALFVWRKNSNRSFDLDVESKSSRKEITSILKGAE